MNHLEREIVGILARGRRDFGYLGFKAEFEAEGTRSDELLRLSELARRAGLKIALKIGGCEALRDLYEARQIGADWIIAPMIESPYALSKFIAAKNRTHTRDEQRDTGFLFNLETVDAYHRLLELLKQGAQDSGVSGVVFGRTDFAGSRGLPLGSTDDPIVEAAVLESATHSRRAGLEFVVGGGISVASLPALRRVAEVHLTRFETRKVVFSAEALANPRIEDGLREATRAELLWLRNKRDHYVRIADEDGARIEVLEARARHGA